MLHFITILLSLLSMFIHAIIAAINLCSLSILEDRCWRKFFYTLLLKANTEDINCFYSSPSGYSSTTSPALPISRYTLTFSFHFWLFSFLQYPMFKHPRRSLIFWPASVYDHVVIYQNLEDFVLPWQGEEKKSKKKKKMYAFLDRLKREMLFKMNCIYSFHCSAHAKASWLELDEDWMVATWSLETYLQLI